MDTLTNTNATPTKGKTMFACTLEAKAISNREILAAFQDLLDSQFHKALAVRVMTSETFADGSVRALVRWANMGTIHERAYGFHYCEHDERVIVDLFAS